jgi:tRNA1Val (adenine37-N6)-methyltransferase
MSNSYFAFKQFKVFHDRCAMKVGTDGVLLGAWTDTEGCGRILDVGTGTGLIAIMLAQRSTAVIDAVEIDPDAYGQAVENKEACPWKERISVWNDSFQHFANSVNAGYDLVVSNPPYFHHSLKPPVISRSLARHDERLGYENLLQGTKSILNKKGRLAVIIPAGESVHFTELAYFVDLFPQRITWVRPHPDKNKSRCLMEFSFQREKPRFETELVIKNPDNQTYTEAYIELTEEYYLNLKI